MERLRIRPDVGTHRPGTKELKRFILGYDGSSLLRHNWYSHRSIPGGILIYILWFKRKDDVANCNVKSTLSRYSLSTGRLYTQTSRTPASQPIATDSFLSIHNSFGEDTCSILTAAMWILGRFLRWLELFTAFLCCDQDPLDLNLRAVRVLCFVSILWLLLAQ